MFVSACFRITASDKKKKQKLLPRCTSPSHFLQEDSNLPTISSQNLLNNEIIPAVQQKNEKNRIDQLFTAVSSMYYRSREQHPNGTDIYVSAEYDKTELPTIDMLMNPLRKSHPFGMYSTDEVNLSVTTC